MNNLSVIRNLYGATQSEFAKLINVNRASLSGWENNKMKMTTTSIYKIATFLEINPKYIYDEELTPEIEKQIINRGKKHKSYKENENFIYNDYSPKEFEIFLPPVEYVKDLLNHIELYKLELMYKGIVYIENIVKNIIDEKTKKEH